MPIYEYECDKCGSTFEAIQSISAKPLKTCQGMGCNGKDNGKVHRLLSAGGFILKGSGWYATDYPSEARKKGWEKESKQGKPETPAAPATADSGGPQPNKKPAPQPAKPPVQKNPYSSKKPKAKSKVSE